MNADTLEKMRRMRLLGMHRAFKTSLEASTQENLTADELIAMLVDSEWDDRHNRQIERSLRDARFRYKATIEQLEYSSERGLDKNTVHRLADGEFIKTKENVLITGPTGTGKSFLLQPSATSPACKASKCFMPMQPGCLHNLKSPKLMALQSKS